MTNEQPVTYNASTRGNNSDGKITVVNINLLSLKLTLEFNGNQIEIRAWHVIAFLIILGGSTTIVTTQLI